MATSVLNTSHAPDRKTSNVQLSSENYQLLLQQSPEGYIAIDHKYVFKVEPCAEVSFNAIGLPKKFVNQKKIPIPGAISFEPLRREQVRAAAQIDLEVNTIQSVKSCWEEHELALLTLSILHNSILYETQTLEVSTGGHTFTFTVQEIASEDQESSEPYAKVTEQTILRFFHAATCPIKIIHPEEDQGVLHGELNFQRLGIGGMGNQERTFFRRVIASRQIGKSLLKQLGVTHLRGILLYGPPGTGKTLIARKLGETLKARPPKIVNGPEILDKFVGASEEKIRELFKDAEEEQRLHGDNSMLHVIIFDEIDALCKVRGSVQDSTGVSDNIVNQLLGKLDGVNPLNNVMVIGMTNRLDLIDPAILRPGRLELHIEVGLPDEDGRLEILNIHTSTMKHHNRLALDDFSLRKVAKLAQNYTGAECQALVKAAVDFAIERNKDDVRVTFPDFENGLKEVRAAHGHDEVLQRCVELKTKESQDLKKQLVASLNHFRSTKSKLTTILVAGEEGTGKTTLAFNVAKESGCACVKVITPGRLLGLTENEGKFVGLVTFNYPESAKVVYLVQTFLDAQKAPESLVVLDDLEGLIEYVPLIEHYNASLLQTIKVKLSQAPVTGHKMAVLATTGAVQLLERLQLNFQTRVNVSALSNTDEMRSVISATRPPPASMETLLTGQSSLPIRTLLARSISAY